MLRVLLIVALAVSLIALFLLCLGVVLKIEVLIIVAMFVLMLDIFLNVLALVIRPEENYSQFIERATAGTPLARPVLPAANLPRPRR
uniref:Uncharacterized protein n=1 Tax=Pagoda dogwood waikavirus TaxID=3115792 RepID=A0AAT9J7Y0_9SECO